MSHPLQHQLKPVETAAKGLSWSRERPWRCSSHLGTIDGLPAVDLHDLSVKLALEVLRLLDADPPAGVVLITGRGRHSGGHSVLRKAVLGWLDKHELPHTPRGPGRIQVSWDPEAVRRAQPGLGLLFWLMVGLLVTGLLAALWQRL